MASGLRFRSFIHFEFILYTVYGNILISFTRNCPVVPVPLIEDTVCNPLYILISFVIDYLTVCAWLYFWALYSVP